jgi:hypothetical protein
MPLSVRLARSGHTDAMQLCSKYKAMFGLFISSGVLAEVLMICSFPSRIWLFPLFLFGFLGVFIRCPECKMPLGYFPDGIEAASERCRRCGRATAYQSQLP